MTFLQYVLAAFVAFSGLFAGAYVARLAKEEMPKASGYFSWFQKILLIIIVAVSLNLSSAGLVVRLVVYAALAFFLLGGRVRNVYPLMGLFFFFAGASGLFEISTLVFLYGFPTGSLFMINLKKSEGVKRVVGSMLFKYGWFLLVAVGLEVFRLFVLVSA